MIRNKTFLKKTRKGGILKVIREHYLREDITCGCDWCTVCEQDVEKCRLSAKPTLSSQICPFKHYIMPDTNVVLHQVIAVL